MTRSPLAAVLRARQVGWVLTASLVGRLPLGATPLAILLYANGHLPTSAAAILVGGYTAGTAFGQPVLARLTDRWRQPPVICAAVALSTLGFLLLAARPGFGWQFAGALAAGVGVPPEACLRVLWKDLVPVEYLHSAYTVDIASQELIFIVGPLVSVAAAHVAGTAGALLVIAAAQLCGALAFAAAPAVRAWRGVVAARHWAGPLRAPGVVILAATTALVGAAVGAATIAVAGYARAAGTPGVAGWLLAAQATGALVGGLLIARRPRLGAPQRLVLILVALAVGYAPPLLVPPFPVMVVLMGISGLALPPALAAIFAGVDRTAPTGTATEAFAWIGTAFAVGSALGSAGNGTVASVRLAFVAAPVLIAAAALLSRAGRSTTARDSDDPQLSSSSPAGAGR